MILIIVIYNVIKVLKEEIYMYSNIIFKIHMFDNFVLDNIKKYLGNKYLDKIMPKITCLGNLGVIWIAIAFFLRSNPSYRSVGNTVFLVLIVSTIIGEGIIKHLVKRARPFMKWRSDKLLIEKPISYSFPSGHTLSSFAVAELLSIHFTQYTIIFIGIALLIALSRLYLYVHYPTDVIAGIILGVLCSKLTLYVIPTLNLRGFYAH